MSKFVIDSSALLAYLWDEKGATFVEAYLSGKLYMSTANWAEVLSKSSDWGIPPKELESVCRSNGLLGGILNIVPLTKDDAKSIGELRKITKSQGLSLGDRACLALSLRLKIPVLTADQTWSKLKLNTEIAIIR